MNTTVPQTFGGELALAGTIVTLLSKSDMNFNAAGSSTATEMVLVRALNVSAHREGIVVLRAHGDHTTAAGQTLVLKAYNTAPTSEDPAREFVDTTTVIATCTLTMTSAGTLVKFAQVSAPFGPYIKFVLFATQTNQGTAFTATVSADGVFRE